MANELVLVVGASGRTGRRVVKALRRHGFRVRAMIRDAAARELVAGEGVEVFVGDVTREEDARRALDGATYVVSALGSKGATDAVHIELIEYTTIAELAQLAQEAGIRHFVLCSSMGVEIPDLIPPLAPILRQKRRGELALEGSGVPFTIVRPGGLTDEPGGGGVAIARTLHDFGMISRDDVAEVMVQALLQPEAKNKIVEIVNAPDAGPADRPDLFAGVA
ncbi:MAG: SDR family oxidoreductase [Thermoflexales bacterium]